MGNVTRVEIILKEYKYVEIKVAEYRRTIKDIQNNTPGALKAICNDSIKVSPTYSISNIIENSVNQKSSAIDELEIQIYTLQRNNRLIDKTLDVMGERYKYFFHLKYIKELSNKEISAELNLSERYAKSLNRRLLDKMSKTLLE